MDSADAPPDRLRALLRFCTKESRILEIGPSHAPIAPRAKGWNTAIIDHDTREGLREKYAPVTDVSAIEEVDFIWRGGKLHHAVPEQHWGGFDVLIASHVIEHIPDFIAFFAAAAVLLKPGGVISLAVPDKRYCFDCFRPHTTTGEALAARGRSRHSERAIFDNVAYFAQAGGQGAWDARPPENLRFLWPLSFAGAELERLRRAVGHEYADFHGSVFTPASFDLLVLELGHLGVLDWHIARHDSAQGCEFIVHLRRGVPPVLPGALDAARRHLAIATLLDLHSQAETLLEAEPELRRAAPPVPPSPDGAAALVSHWAQRFVLLVHGGDYEAAAQLEPLFADLAATAQALAGLHSDRLHTLYCLAVLSLFRGELPRAAKRFRYLMRQAQLCRDLPEAEALGEEFLALAAPHCAALQGLDAA